MDRVAFPVKMKGWGILLGPALLLHAWAVVIVAKYAFD